MSSKKTFAINEISIFIQICLGLFAIIWAVISLFENKFLSIAEICLSLSLFFMAYNNHKIYRKKNATFIYILLGVGLLLVAIGILI
ncbi:MAG: hypothetical protein ACM3O4_04070 [Ignavibacteriales bacterium]